MGEQVYRLWWMEYVYRRKRYQRPRRHQSLAGRRKKKRHNPLPLPSIVAGHTHGLTPAMVSSTACWEGLVYGSIVLVGGQPGIRKSTLMLQLAMHAGARYCMFPVRRVPNRLRCGQIDWVQREKNVLSTETSSRTIIEESKKLHPALLIIDSIQTLYSPFIDAPPTQHFNLGERMYSRAATFAKESNIPIIIIGHITKEGGLAG